MKTSGFSHYAFSCSVTAALLAGCGGSQPPIGAPSAMPQNRAAVARPDHSGSWMLPEAKGEDLLYVSNYSNVVVFSYPQGKLVGMLEGFYSAVGECIDAKGDAFIANFKPITVYEYAHGGTKRIAQFPTKKAGTVGCAINPINGDLAITGGSGYVEIYKGAQQGKPVVLNDKAMLFGSFCTYDNRGNLFFAGVAQNYKHTRLSELPANSSKFITIKTSVDFDSDASIQWVKNSLATVAFLPPKAKRRKPEIVTFSINGTEATKISEIPLNKPAYTIVQFLIDGKMALIANLRNPSGDSGGVLFYNYPKGGSPYRDLTKRLTSARGVAVSAAQ